MYDWHSGGSTAGQNSAHKSSQNFFSSKNKETNKTKQNKFETILEQVLFRNPLAHRGFKDKKTHSTKCQRQHS
jgi:hypothetical protein